MKLKNCPFCGCEANMNVPRQSDEGDIGGYFVECISPLCNASSKVIYDTGMGADVEDLIASAWNQRAKPNEITLEADP